MRINYASTTHCAHVAKALKREISLHIPDITLSACHNAVGRMMGYRNWQELKAHAKAGVVESQPDERVPAEEAAMRAVRQVAVLKEDMGLPHTTAEGIVSRLKPTGRRPGLVAQTAPGWRRTLDRLRSTPGLASHDEASHDHYLARTGGAEEQNGVVWKSRRLKGIGEVRFSIRVGDDLDTGFRIDDLRAVHVEGGRILASMDGYVVDGTDLRREECAFCASMFEEADEDDEADEMLDGIVGEVRGSLRDAADEVEDDIAGAMMALTRDGDIFRLLACGRVLVLTDLTRDMTRTESGHGARFLAAVIAMYNGRRKDRVGALAVEPDPAGYEDMEDNAARISKDWMAARDHLLRWFRTSPAILSALGEDGEVVSYDTGPANDGPDPAMAMLVDRGLPDDETVDGPDSPYPLGRTLLKTARLWAFDADGPGMPETLPTEPKAFMVGEFPAGFDVKNACLFRRVRPHPALWDFMPSEVVSLKVLPTAGDTASGRPNVTLVARFENGSELDLPEPYLIGGERYMVALPAITTLADTFVRENPYASRMTVWDMQKVLTINGMLLFDGSPNHVAFEMTRPVEIRRPDRMPRILA